MRPWQCRISQTFSRHFVESDKSDVDVPWMLSGPVSYLNSTTSSLVTSRGCLIA